MKKNYQIPGCVDSSSRGCFGIKWFDTEESANLFAAEVKAAGLTYNGGWYHGKACGREESFDREVNGRKLYAVTC